MSTQLVQPNLYASDYPGFCLRFTQEVFGTPARYKSAWEAWNATTLKFETSEMPDVSVPVWFSHWGTYGEPPEFANWGHVVTWVPGRGFLSSPGSGNIPSRLWLGSIEEVEKTFNSTLVGFSLDLNGLQVATYDKPTPPLPKKDERGNKMLMCHIPQGASNGVNNHYAIFGSGFFFEFDGDDAANAWIVQIGGQQSAAVNRQTMDAIKAASFAKA